MAGLPALTSNDILALQALKAWADDQPTDRDRAYLVALRQRESALTPKALAVWNSWPADPLAAELARWRPTFLVEKTAAGFRAFAWIRRQRRYAKRPCQARMTAAEAAAYSHSLIRT